MNGNIRNIKSSSKNGSGLSALTAFFRSLKLIRKNTSDEHSKISFKKSGIVNSELQKFILNADAYLHYSNGLIFYIVKYSPASETVLILISTCNSDQLYSFLFILIKGFRRPVVYFVSFIENANIFDGVIDRYCGVPP